MPASCLLKACLTCGTPSGQLCGGCLLVSFCNPTCQRASWTKHKAACMPRAAAGAALVSPSRAAPTTLPKASMSSARVLQLMCANARDVRVVEAGLVALVVKLGGPGTLADRQASLGGDVKVVVDAVKAMARAGGGGATTSGSVGTVAVAALGNFSGDAGIAAQASRLLRILSDPAGDDWAGGAAMFMAVPDGLSALAGVLSRHADVPMCCEEAGGALGNVFCLPMPLAGMCIRAAPDTPELLVAALRRHAAASPSLAARLCGALALVAFSHEDGLGAGATAAVLDALRLHPTDAAVVSDACDALTNLSAKQFSERQTACRAAIVGAAPELLEVLRTHAATHPSACSKALSALRNAASDASNVTAVVSAGATQAVVALLKMHVSDLDICEPACAVLYCLAAHSEAARAEFRAEGLPLLLLEVMRLHADSSLPTPSTTLLVRACAFTLFMSVKSNKACADEVIAAGAVPLFVKRARFGGEDRPEALNLLNRLGYDADGKLLPPAEEKASEPTPTE